jgi:hypothetical protein
MERIAAWRTERDGVRPALPEAGKP